MPVLEGGNSSNSTVCRENTPFQLIRIPYLTTSVKGVKQPTPLGKKFPHSILPLIVLSSYHCIMSLPLLVPGSREVHILHLEEVPSCHVPHKELHHFDATP